MREVCACFFPCCTATPYYTCLYHTLQLHCPHLLLHGAAHQCILTAVPSTQAAIKAARAAGEAADAEVAAAKEAELPAFLKMDEYDDELAMDLAEVEEEDDDEDGNEEADGSDEEVNDAGPAIAGS